MDVQNILNRIGTELVKQLVQAQTPEALVKMAAEHHRPLSGEEAQALFDALTPLRGKQPIDDADLLEVQGGGGQGIARLTEKEKADRERLASLANKSDYL